jgi:hypothetical protein
VKMVKIYKNKNANIMVRYLYESITELDTAKIIKTERKIFAENDKTYIIIGLFEKDFKLVNKKVIHILAEHSLVYYKRYDHSYFVGVTGVNRIFLNLYNLLAAKSYPRELVSTMAELEKKLNFTFPNDFIEIE